MCFFGISAENKKTHGNPKFPKVLGAPNSFGNFGFLEILDLEIAPQKTPLEIQAKSLFLPYYFQEIPHWKIIWETKKTCEIKRSLIPNILSYMMYISSLLKIYQTIGKISKIKEIPNFKYVSWYDFMQSHY